MNFNSKRKSLFKVFPECRSTEETYELQAMCKQTQPQEHHEKYINVQIFIYFLLFFLVVGVVCTAPMFCKCLVSGDIMETV